MEFAVAVIVDEVVSGSKESVVDVCPREVEVLEPCAAAIEVVTDVAVECAFSAPNCSAGTLWPTPDAMEEAATSVPPEVAQPTVRSINSGNSHKQHICRIRRKIELFRAVLRFVGDVVISIRLISQARCTASWQTARE
ncbi:MAG: hypothetical protein ACOX8V_04650 [Thermoleophilia bacterium]